MVLIENEHISVGIKPTGAELSTLVKKTTEREYMWQGDQRIWKGQAPILFPIIGELKDGKTIIKDKCYSMKRHGFLRTQQPNKITNLPNGVCFTFTANEETKTQFPCEFELRVTFELHNHTLTNSFEIINRDSDTLAYNLGAHPAFALEPSSENYFIEFEQNETSPRHCLNEKGLFNGKTQQVIVGNKLALKPNLFNNDALVFKSLNSKSISLKNPKDETIVKMNIENWPYLGVWSKPKAPFVCLEPWIGCADSELSDGNFLNKELIQLLEPSKSNFHQLSLTI